MFPSLERSAKNQSELSLLKLPEIGGAAVGSLKKVSGRQNNESTNNHHRESLGPPSVQQLGYRIEQYQLQGGGRNHIEERKEKLK